MSRNAKAKRSPARQPPKPPAITRRLAAEPRPPRPLFPPPRPAHWTDLLAWAALLAIIGVGLFLQWPGIGNDVLESVHGWRQCQTAMTSRNFVKDGMNPLIARVDYIGDGQMQLELPLYQYLVAICYFIFGVHEIWGRIIALLFGIGSAVVLFQIGRMLWSTLTGLLAAAVFSWSPLDVFFNRAFLPDSSTICFTLLALWLFLLYFRDNRTRDLVFACIAVALSLAGKPPIAATVLPPLAVALFLAHGWRIWKQPRLLIGLTAAAVFFGAWMGYSSYVNNNKSDDLRNAGLSFTNAADHNSEKLSEWFFGTPKLRGDPATYRRIFRRTRDWVGHWYAPLAIKAEQIENLNAAIARTANPAQTESLREQLAREESTFSPAMEFVCHYGFFALAFLGIALSWRTRMQWILPAWFLGCTAYVFIFVNVNYIHNYYQMPIIPMLALAAAVGVDRLVAAIAFLIPKSAPPSTAKAPRTNLPRIITAVIVALAFCFAQASASYAVLRDYDARNEFWSPGRRAFWGTMPPFVVLGREIHKHLPDQPGLLALTGPSSLVADCRDPQLHYYVDRRGFVLQTPNEEMEKADQAALNEVRAGKLRPEMLRSRRNQLKAQWLDAKFLKILDAAMQKGVRILAVVSPAGLLSPQTMTELTRRHKLYYHDPAGQFDVYTLNP